MVTRFSASEARIKAESVQKALEEQRLKDKEHRKNLAKERAFVKEGFEKQRELLIAAALEGKTDIELQSVVLFKDLLNLGLQIAEVGSVTNQGSFHGVNINPAEVERLKQEVLDSFDKFIDISKNDMKGFYGSVSAFRKSNYSVLIDELNSNSGFNYFIGDEVYDEMVPEYLRSEYSDYLYDINERIEQYRNVIDAIEFRKNTTFKDLIQGQYIFSQYDDPVNILTPSVEGNKFKIKWGLRDTDDHMNEPLLSEAGLSWLSCSCGDQLFTEIFKSLTNAAEQGKLFKKLNFSLSKHGWLFVNVDEKIPSCMPDEIVEIIANEGFKIENTTSTSKSYSIKVVW